MLQIDSQAIQDLRALLDDLHYDAILRSLHPNYFYWPFPLLEAFEAVTRQLPERERVSYDCLLLGKPVRRNLLENLWGSQRVAALTSVGLLESAGASQLRTANYSIVSFLGFYFVVTLNPYYPGSRDPDASVYIGPDSLTLAPNLFNLATAERGLDLCTGSGIQAIVMASKTKEVVAVELNAEAARAAAFNAILNGVGERVRICQGNLYQVVPEGTYDLIVSNPPFLPVPPGVHFPLCGNGGEDGLQLLKPLLDGIPARLAQDGTALIYSEGVGDADGPFVRHLLHDLSESEPLNVHILVLSRLTIKSTLVLKAVSLSRLKPQEMDELARWRDLYQRLGATHSYKYLLRIKRGQMRIRQVFAFDPQREEQGIEIQPGVLIKPRQ